MGVKNLNQIKKDYVKRSRILRDQRKQARLEIERLPEVDKLEYEISVLEGYVNRYKNDLGTPIIASKVNMYKNQIAEKKQKIGVLKAQQVVDIARKEEIALNVPINISIETELEVNSVVKDGEDNGQSQSI